MSAKFTKGEWEQDYEGAYHSVWCENQCIAIMHNDGDDDYDESLANSHLIAAAPELYELLEEMASYDECQRFKKQINELLAKARGEQNA